MSSVAQQDRIYFLDHLRTFMIFLVVMLHAGVVYESSGAAGFFWIVYDFSTNPVVDVLNTILDIFIMAIIFFVSGYLTPLSLKCKSVWAFTRTKLKRLMLPWALGVLFLMPLYKMIFLASRGMPQQHWTTYVYFNNGIFSQSWLWFLPVLFLFNLLYLGLSRLKLKGPRFSLRAMVVLVFVVGLAYSVTMDFLNLEGWTKNALFNFQNERLLIYFMVFLLGAFFQKRRVFISPLKNRMVFFLTVCTVWVPVALYRYLHMNPGTSVLPGAVEVLAHWLSFHLSLAGVMFVLINTFRMWINGQGKVTCVLNANAYGVYVIHTVVMGGVAWLLLDVAMPSVVKFCILTLATYGLSNGVVWFYHQGKMWFKNA